MVDFLRRIFLKGFLVLLPIILCSYLFWISVTFLDEVFKFLILLFTDKRVYLFYHFPGIGIIAFFLLVFLTGILVNFLIGKFFLKLIATLFRNIPLIGSIYEASDRVFQTIAEMESDSFSRVVLVKFPNKNIYSLAFISALEGMDKLSMKFKQKDEIITVFVPTAPNPTSGFVCFIKKEDLIFVDISVKEAMEIILSAGVSISQEKFPKN